MPKKATPNTDFMLNTAKEYIDETGNDLSFKLDYGYDLEKRYKAMVKEDHEIADLIYDCLVEQGSDYAMDESTEQNRKRVKKQYDFVMSVFRDRS